MERSRPKLILGRCVDAVLDEEPRKIEVTPL
jgi:hypothetical protein